MKLISLKSHFTRVFLFFTLNLYLNSLFGNSNLNSLSYKEEISSIRKGYVEALDSKIKTKDMLTNLSLKLSKAPIFLAYYGAFQGLMAKHANSPIAKFEFLTDSKKSLANAIKLDPNNPEIRFLRFSLEYYIPNWLGFSSNIQSDKKVIIQNIDLVTDKEVQKTIAKFLIETKLCNLQEIDKLKHIYN